MIKMISYFKDLMKNMVQLESTTDLSDTEEETRVLQSYGYALLYLYRLIQMCPLKSNKSNTFLSTLIDATDTVLCEISLDVYASWEEVNLFRAISNCIIIN